MLRREDKAMFLSPAFHFLSQKRITSKMWTDIPKTLSKICVNISKCQSMLFKTNILMKMKLYQYFYEKKIFEIQIPTRSKKYFYYAINCLHLWICNGSIKYFQIFACLFWGILCKWNLHHCGQR